MVELGENKTFRKRGLVKGTWIIWHILQRDHGTLLPLCFPDAPRCTGFSQYIPTPTILYAATGPKEQTDSSKAMSSDEPRLFLSYLSQLFPQHQKAAKDWNHTCLPIYTLPSPSQATPLPWDSSSGHLRQPRDIVQLIESLPSMQKISTLIPQTHHKQGTAGPHL